MQIEGKKYICERCGIEHFAKKFGHLNFGKYEDRSIFEIPVGWTIQQHEDEWRDLCPTCSEELQRVIDRFWEKSEDEDGEINDKV